MNNDYKINLAVQILPQKGKIDVELIHKAIQCIQQSGLKHRVTPLETVIEGYYDEIMAVVKNMQTVCYEAGATDILLFMKIQSKANNDVRIEDKLDKYE